MSLRSQDPPTVPEETCRVADALGPVYQDSQFTALFPRRGQPAEAPGRLALAVVLQFVEDLSDREAADAVRGASRRSARSRSPRKAGRSTRRPAGRSRRSWQPRCA